VEKKSRDVPVEEPMTATRALTDVPVVTAKDLSRTDMAEAEASGIQTYGNPGAWKCICKAWNEKEGWMKSTKAMQVGSAGCLIQVTTQQKNPDGSYSLAEAVCFAERANLTEVDGVAKLM
jgi:hypothetical protein